MAAYIETNFYLGVSIVEANCGQTNLMCDQPETGNVPSFLWKYQNSMQAPLKVVVVSKHSMCWISCTFGVQIAYFGKSAAVGSSLDPHAWSGWPKSLQMRYQIKMKHVLSSLRVFEGIPQGRRWRVSKIWFPLPLAQATLLCEVFQHFRQHELEQENLDDYRNATEGQGNNTDSSNLLETEETEDGLWNAEVG